MKFFRSICLIIILALASGIVSHPAKAQRSGEQDIFTTPETGVTISLGSTGEATLRPGDYRFTNTPYYAMEETWFERDGTFMAVHVLEGDFTPEEWRDQQELMLTTYHQGWAEFTGISLVDDSGWFLAQGHFYLDLVEMTYSELYMDFEEGLHVAVAVWSHPSSLVENVVWMQDNVTVNGNPVLTNTSLDILSMMVEGDLQYGPEQLPYPMSTIEDWESEGLESDSTWHGYYHDTEVTWDTTVWNVPLHHPEPAYHEAENRQSGLALETENSTARVWLHVGDVPDGLTMSDRVKAWTDEDEMRSRTYEYPALDFRFTESQGSMIAYTERGYGTVTIQIRETFVGPDGEGITMFIESTPENLPDAYSKAINLIQIDGNHVEPSWTNEEIEDISSTFVTD